jgi:uncharacterized protein
MAVAELGMPALFLAGLAASPHCSLMCGPIQLSQLQGCGSAATTAAWLHAGRVLGYACLGGVAGMVGAQLMFLLPSEQAGIWVRTAGALLMCLIGLSLWRARSRSGCAKRRRHAAGSKVLLRGITWAMVPCGMLYAMLLLASLSAGATSGALLMTAFGLGTVPLSMGSALALRRLRLSPERFRPWAAGVLSAFGALSLIAIWNADSISGWCRALAA